MLNAFEHVTLYSLVIDGAGWQTDQCLVGRIMYDSIVPILEKLLYLDADDWFAIHRGVILECKLTAGLPLVIWHPRCISISDKRFQTNTYEFIDLESIRLNKEIPISWYMCDKVKSLINSSNNVIEDLEIFGHYITSIH